jgi:neutral ceramidase
MQNTNQLISGDNKGYAMYLFEQLKNGNNTKPGMGPFVAIFSNSNEGDVTPNTKGAFCPNGLACNYFNSTCNGQSETCHGEGPGSDDFNSTQIIGYQQFIAALSAYNKAEIEIKGYFNYIHQWVDMSKVQVQPQFTGLNQTVSTCIPALGDSFAAGTTDGAGDFDFTQGSNSTSDNPFWNLFGHLISPPPTDQVQCHYPKPILLYTGGVNIPTAWTPTVLPLQIFQLGQLFIIAVPGEFTTMSGRRLRNAVLSVVKPYYPDAVVVIAGLSNAYSQYVATPEEYDDQRYEGASTLFGPYTLPAYIQLYTNLAQALVTGKNVPPGTPPTDWSADTINILPGPDPDKGRPPGFVLVQPNPSYRIGTTVNVTMISSDPRNNFKTQDSYLYVQLKVSTGWMTVAVDGHWETKFIWNRPGPATESYAQILWDTSRAIPGTYQIVHNGTALTTSFQLVPFSGTTNSFTLS